MQLNDFEVQAFIAGGAISGATLVLRIVFLEAISAYFEIKQATQKGKAAGAGAGVGAGQGGDRNA